MSSPVITWRVRRWRTLWPFLRAHGGKRWIGLERCDAAADSPTETEPQTFASRPNLLRHGPSVTGDACHWLAVLRLDRAVCAVREPD
jgi:hypothetical protein